MFDEDVNKLVGTSESSHCRVFGGSISCGQSRIETHQATAYLTTNTPKRHVFHLPNLLILCKCKVCYSLVAYWMTQLEIGLAREDAADTLHPCWEAYHLAEGYSSLPFLSYGSRAWKGFISLCTGCFLFSHIFSIKLTMNFILVHVTASQSLHFFSTCFLVKQLWISQVLYRQHEEG